MLRRWCCDRIASITRSRRATTGSQSSWTLPIPHRSFHIKTALDAEHTPLRKELKNAARLSRSGQDEAKVEERRVKQERLKDWELTVGIEIHAQLNTSSKLFSCESFVSTSLATTCTDLLQVQVLSIPMFQMQRHGRLTWLSLVASLCSRHQF